MSRALRTRLASSRFWTAALAGPLLVGCMSNPRNGSTLGAPNEPILFNGLVPNAADSVTFKVRDQSDGSLDALVTATADTEVYINDGFLDWFLFEATPSLPYGAGSMKYWRSATRLVGSQPRMAADVVGTSAAQGNLFSFDVDATACVLLQPTGQEVVNNCRSVNSPVATLYANCGNMDQPCCLTNGSVENSWCGAGTCLADRCRPIVADTTCPWGSPTCNRCVWSVVASFNAINAQGNHMGYRMGAGHPDVDLFYIDGKRHWQGIARLSGDNSRFFSVTSNQDDDAWMAIVEIGSRASVGGAKLGPTKAFAGDTPPSTDRIVKAHKVSVASDHPGGIQMLGNLAFVPLSRESATRVVDLSNPLAPVESERITGVQGGHFNAVAMLNSGHALLANGTCSGGSECADQGGLRFHFMVTPGKGTRFGSSAAANGVTVTVNRNTIVHENGTTGGWHEIQNANFITECGTGKLFLLATTEDEDPHESWAYLFEATLDWNNVASIKSASLKMVGKRRLFCTTGGSDSLGCDLHAAGGTYITPIGKLIIYGTEHFNDGGGGSVRMKEFAQP